MKTILSGVIAVAIIASATFSASAQGSMGANEAYCATMKGDQNAGKMNCSYKTMAACEAAVKGDQGTCSKNAKVK
jgi:hypothetical protein